MSTHDAEEKISAIPSDDHDDGHSVTSTPEEPFSSQFLQRGKAASRARNIYIKILLQRTCLIIVAISAIFPIYWGALWQVPARSLEGWIVDFDGARIGQNIIQELGVLSNAALRWKVRPSNAFPGGASDLVNAVVEEHCWVAVAINVGATANLERALRDRGASYDASSAITVSEHSCFERSILNNCSRTLLRPAIDTWLQKITHDFAIKLFAEFASNSTMVFSSIAPKTLV